MTKKEIKQLAEASYTNDSLDEKRVEEIAVHLDRKMLKAYLRELRRIEKGKNVIIALPSVKSYNNSEKLFADIFKNKNIIVEEDPSLILGIRVTDKDMIFEQSLNNSLETYINTIKKEYE